MLPSIFRESLLSDMFNDVFEMIPAFGRSNLLYGKDAQPLMKTDITQSDEGYQMKMDLPGFKKEDLEVKLSDGYITIYASTNKEAEEKNDKGEYIRQERYSGTCSRSFYVGDQIHQEDISAKFEDGTLTLTLPKKEAKALPANNTIAIE
ncbi:MAG: Hsp20/alpha crystallin family protein [Clostridiales bacterium]|nr:Hsp20/alpha crystallin family protein [Clostridiales bacterium]